MPLTTGRSLESGPRASSARWPGPPPLLARRASEKGRAACARSHNTHICARPGGRHVHMGVRWNRVARLERVPDALPLFTCGVDETLSALTRSDALSLKCMRRDRSAVTRPNRRQLCRCAGFLMARLNSVNAPNSAVHSSITKLTT